jgi:hypothetical protein
MRGPMRSFFLFAVAAFVAMPLFAQTPTAPQPHQVTGFRSALWGMTAQEVRAAIRQDFAATDDAITEIDNPAEQTRVIAVKLASLEPAPGPAVLAYVLGARTKRLVRVNVTWTSDANPSDPDRNRMGAAGLQLAAHFRGLDWKAGGTVTNQREGANAVLLFAGVDPKDAAIELHLDGVYLTDAKGTGNAPSGPVKLRIAYIADLRRPDVAGAAR